MPIAINQTVFTEGDVVFYRHNDGSIRKAAIQKYQLANGSLNYLIGGEWYDEAKVSDQFEALRAVNETEISAEIAAKEKELTDIKSLTEADAIDEISE